MSSDRLELRGITAGYGATTVLRDVDLTAPAGMVSALIGPNGAGKTTLLRTASGLLPPRSGVVFLDGEDVSRCPSDQMVKRGVCHIPEGRGIFPSLTVGDNLRVHDRGGGEAALARVIAAFPVLGTRVRQLAGTMSGGEQQMLALARTYLAAPRYVLVDEVSMGLAPKVVDQIFEFLSGLAADGVALLVVEQYVHRVLELADVVYVLNRGRIVFAGQPSEIDPDVLATEYLGVGAG